MYEEILLIIGIILIVVIWCLKLVHWIVKIVITVFAVGLVLNYFGMLAVLNQPINLALAGSPPLSCAYDSDCTLKVTLCQPCDCGSAINKDWTRFCPLKDMRTNVVCQPCPQPGTDFTIHCVSNTCQEANITG